MAKIIYICGMGHNGSTSLDLLLDLSKSTCGTGQLNDLLVPYDPAGVDAENWSDRERFWQGVLDDLSAEQRNNLQVENRAVLKERRLLPFVFSRKSRRSYAAINDLLIDRVAARAERDIVIDSSKNIARCIGLLAGRHDVRVVHLTRDIRGYVESHNKRRREIGLKNAYLKPALVWMAKNYAASLFVRPIARNYTHIRYEDLLQQPSEVLRELEKLCDLSLSECEAAAAGLEPLRPAESLGFGGNRVLHNRQEVCLDPTRIKRDGLYLSRLFWFTIGWPSKFWGYRFVGNSA